MLYCLHCPTLNKVFLLLLLLFTLTNLATHAREQTTKGMPGIEICTTKTVFTMELEIIKLVILQPGAEFVRWLRWDKTTTNETPGWIQTR